VIDKRVGKSRRVMAKSAIGRGCRVWRSRCLTPGAKSREIAIMAGHAIGGNARVSQHRCRGEPGNRMASVTILASRQMTCSFYQLRIGWEKLAGMTTFATIGDVHMLGGQKNGRGKSSGGIVTITTYVERRDVIWFLAYRTCRDVIGITIVATLTIVGDTRVKEGLCWHERSSSGVTNDAILGCR